jgi:1-deoxy-D-xylulose-5-phosphate reductoisomerase
VDGDLVGGVEHARGGAAGERGLAREPQARERVEVGQLTFERADEETFRCLHLAREAGREGGTAPCILNAATEVAVHAFLQGRIGFLRIAEIVEATLDAVEPKGVHAFETLYAADRAARDAAAELVAREE